MSVDVIKYVTDWGCIAGAVLPSSIFSVTAEMRTEAL